MNQARAIGNRVLYAEDVLARPFESANERESCNVALDWLKSRAVAWPQASGNGGPVLQEGLNSTPGAMNGAGEN